MWRKLVCIRITFCATSELQSLKGITVIEKSRSIGQQLTDYYLVYSCRSQSDKGCTKIAVCWHTLQTSVKVSQRGVATLLLKSTSLVTDDHPSAPHPFRGDVILSMTSAPLPIRAAIFSHDYSNWSKSMETVDNFKVGKVSAGGVLISW